MERLKTALAMDGWNRSDLWTVVAAVVLPFGWVLLIPRFLRALR